MKSWIKDSYCFILNGSDIKELHLKGYSIERIIPNRKLSLQEFICRHKEFRHMFE